MEKIRERYLAEIAKEKKSVKNYADTYLYNKGNYEKKIFDFMMHTEYVDKSDPSFSDIKFDVKRRQVTSSLIKVLESNQTMLCINSAEAMPRAFKVFVANDIKGDGKSKVFIDVTGLIKLDNGRYVYSSNDIDILISYLLSAMNAKIYHSDPGRIMNRYVLIDEGDKCFSSMFYYILDYLRITGSIDNGRGRCNYLTSKYYQLNILGRSPSKSVNDRALKLSGLSQREADMLEIHLDGIKNPYKDINTFIKAISKILKTKKLTLDVFIDKWMWVYGYGTQFGLELYPAFSTMLINAYVGAYLNNQKTIEKITGRPLVDFVNELFKLGSELL